MKVIVSILLVLLLTTNAYARELYGTGVYAGTISQDDAGLRTATQLSSDSYVIRGLYVKAKAENDGNVYIGGSAVTSADGMVLSGDTMVYLPVTNVNQVYFNADIAGDGVSWIGINERTRD